VSTLKIIFVLGGGTSNDQLSQNSLSRIKQALVFFRSYGANHFFLSGGIISKNQTLSEAQLMANYLEANGLNQRVALDNASLDTWQNIDTLFAWLFDELSHLQSAELPKKIEIDTISDRWHLRRIKYLVDIRLRQYHKSFSGQIKFYYIASPFKPTIRRFLYEIIAYTLTWLDPWGRSWIVRRNRQHHTQS
jgi:uncharacterized SAM-binding protein YcdF (DUF218 family)